MLALMRRTTVSRQVIENVRKHMLASGTDAHTLAKAAGLPDSDMQSRLEGRSDFRMRELEKVSGLFRVPTSSLLIGASQ